jgi:hypothetical protein
VPENKVKKSIFVSKCLDTSDKLAKKKTTDFTSKTEVRNLGRHVDNYCAYEIFALLGPIKNSLLDT